VNKHNKMPRHFPKPHFSVNVDEQVIRHGKTQLKTKLESLGKFPPAEPFNPFLLPSCRIKECTQKEYSNKWHEMMKFFYLIGDLQSAMLVDRELCPVDPLPFKPTSFALYLNFRCEAKGTPLIDHNGVAVIDVNGSPVVCCGKINCPSGLYSIRAAVNFLHEVAYPATCSGLYQSNCRRCEEANQALGSMLQGNLQATPTTVCAPSSPTYIPITQTEDDLIDAQHSSDEEAGALDFEDDDVGEATYGSLNGAISHSLVFFCQLH
jgi:hypothetical protein